MKSTPQLEDEPLPSNIALIEKEMVLTPFQESGWKTILLLQFQPQFEMVIMMAIFISYISTMYDITYVFASNSNSVAKATAKNFLYSFDIIYTIDILSMISFKNIEWDEVKHKYKERHAILILLDILSIIPIDEVYYSLKSINLRILYMLRLRYILRIFRFIKRILDLKNTVGINHLKMECLDFIINSGLLLVTIACVMCMLKYYLDNESLDGVELIGKYYRSTQILTSRGFPYDLSNSTVVRITQIGINFFCFLYVYGFTVGLFLIATFQQLRSEYTFKNKKKAVLNTFYSSKTEDALVEQAVEQYFTLFWKHKKGVEFKSNIFMVVPEIMSKEINLDICWDPLKHSHLFKNKDTHFLRCVSQVMKQRFLIPGETIYKRNKFKSSMVYIVTGVVQILSEQDGETPILSFSGGTCLGESSLLVDCPSTCNVICQSYCEIYILYRKDFVAVSRIYPKEYKDMLKEVRNRHANAHKYKNTLNSAYIDKRYQPEILILKWLKSTLYRLLDEDGNAVKTTKKTLTLEDKTSMKEMTKLKFCYEYLDMLVISEQIQLITDSVFLRSSCPCILQPGSFIVVTWYNFTVICVFIFAVVYPYFAVFQLDESGTFRMCSYFISFLWIVDIYITLSTGVKTKDGIITDMLNIAVYNVRKLTFFLDILSALPLESFILIVLGKIEPQASALLSSLKVLKAYRITSFFDESIRGDSTKCFIKYSTYSLFLMYYVAAILNLIVCPNYVCDNTDDQFSNFIIRMYEDVVFNKLLCWINISSQIITYTAITLDVTGSTKSLHGPFIITEIGVTMFYIFFLCSCAIHHALKQVNLLKLREQAANISIVLHDLNVKPILYKQVVAYIHCQIDYNEGTDITYGQDYYSEFHPVLVKENRRQAYSKILKQIPIFKELPEDLLGNIAQYFYNHLLGPGEVITYGGEVCKEMHILLQGYCIVLGEVEKENQIISELESISVVELCFEAPIIRTIITHTHCQLITITCKRFFQAFQTYPEILLELKKAVASLTPALSVISVTELDSARLECRMNKKFECKSFKVFKYNLERDAREAADYHNFFDRFEFLACLRYVSPRTTIAPYGRFLYCWEISRCVFAFLSTILAPFAVISICEDCAWRYDFYFLDFTAWLDIIVRHFISYFDEKGIEITHPGKTVTYYWKHSFIIDLIAVFPFERVIPPLLPASVESSKNKVRIYLKMLRILQYYRIKQGVTFIDRNHLFPSSLWTTIKFLPFVVVFVSTFGAITMHIECEFSSDIKATTYFKKGVSCAENSWITQTRAKKPLSPIRTHLYGLFLNLILLTGPGIGGLSVQNIKEVSSMIIVVVIGYLFFMYITNVIVATNLFKNSDLTSYQERMKNLVKFLSCKHIDINLKKEIINHFEYVWVKKKANDLHKVVQCFNNALQEDILFDVYGSSVKNSLVFSEANFSFFRSLLLNAKHEVIMKRGIITRVNDVQDKLYILHKGQVEVLGPDYNRLLVLPVGSVFGNIDNCKRSRQTLTMVAKGHVELFSIKTTTFHQLLSNYGPLKAHYFRQITINTDYLSGSSTTFPMEVLYNDVTGEDSLDRSLQTLHSISVKSSVKTSTILGAQKLGRSLVLKKVLFISVCYVSCIIKFYQLTVLDHNPILVTISYLLDVFFLLHMYLTFRTPYENEYGELVYDKRKIARHYIRNLTEFPLQLASIIPLELFAFFGESHYCKWNIWSYCRCNRLIRIYHILQHFSKSSQQLNVNMVYRRTFFLLVWISLMLQSVTCCLVFATCVDGSKSVIPDAKCDWETMTMSEKLGMYGFNMQNIIQFFSSTSLSNYFPNSALVIFSIIILLIITRTATICTISHIGATLDIILNGRVNYEYSVQELKQHMIRERVSPALLERIWLYIQLLWKNNNGLQFPTLLEEAPYYLKEAVLNSMFGYHLRKHELFKLCHVDMIRQVAAQLRTRIFFPGDYITFINDIDDCMYFIHEGAVECLSEEDMYNEKVDATLYKGEMFGFIQGVYVSRGHDYTYRAIKYTVVLVLHRNDWIYLLNFFPASKRVIYPNDVN